MQQIFLGLGAVATKTYVEDVFSTEAWISAGSPKTITNGINFAEEGGMVWTKSRSDAYNHVLSDTVRGGLKAVFSNTDGAEDVNSSPNNYVGSFNNNGVQLGTWGIVGGHSGSSGKEYATWSFRKAKGFFDVLTYTGTGSAHNISHSLGCAPGMIIVKRLNATKDWAVYHRGANDGLEASYSQLELNTSDETVQTNNLWNRVPPTSSVFTVGESSRVNGNGDTYVAYLFADGMSVDEKSRSTKFPTNAYMRANNENWATGYITPDFTLGTNDFTLETWIYPVSCTHDVGIPDPRAANTNAVQCMFGFNSSLQLFVYVNGSHLISPSSSTAMTAKQWQHVAYCRNGSTGKIFLNGKEVASVTDNNNYVAATQSYGWHAFQGATFVGHLSNTRIVNGTAVYTAAFTPPTEPLTNITNTKLLFNNGPSSNYVTPTNVTQPFTVGGAPSQNQLYGPFDDRGSYAFGVSGSESIIKCGHYITDSNEDATVELGWEPQWVLAKRADNSTGGDWFIIDSMRGFNNAQQIEANSGGSRYLEPNTTDTEDNTSRMGLTSTGFYADQFGSNRTFIYMAIRRPDGYVGKPPELGTDVFGMAYGTGTNPAFAPGFPVDFTFLRRPGTTENWTAGARLITGKYLHLNQNAAENNDSNIVFDYNNGFHSGTGFSTYLSWSFKRHAGFDVVAYKGNQTAGHQIRHSLNKIPQMIWCKARNTGGSTEHWGVYHEGISGTGKSIFLNLSNAATGSMFNGTTPTSTYFELSNDFRTNGPYNYIAMLFASVDGISKVGSYTGSGSSNTQTISTGFAPRFVIIKDYTANSNPWYVMDTTRGWASGNDKQLMLDSTQSELTNDWGAPTSTGFTVTGNGINLNTANQKYIYYAHA